MHWSCSFLPLHEMQKVLENTVQSDAVRYITLKWDFGLAENSP